MTCAPRRPQDSGIKNRNLGRPRDLLFQCVHPRENQGFALCGAGKAGVETGGLRRWVACSNPKASFINAHSAQARPRNSIPTGTPIGASVVGVEKPAGTSMAGNPVRAAITPLRSF